MDPRRQETQTAASTTPTIAGMPPLAGNETPAPAAPKRDRGTTTDGVKAGQLFERLAQLDAEEQAEIAASPADIRAKFEDRRARELGKASETVRKLVEKLRAP